MGRSESGKRLIAFLTDFGADSPYAGIVRGVVKGISPGSEIIDVTHSVPPGNVRVGAFLLLQASRWFPEGTIFLAVVDPGVGTERDPVVATGGGKIFIGPDNGLLTPAASMEKVEGVYVIDRSCLPRPPLSETFHGRDIFAPAAAMIAEGVDPARLGREKDGLTPLTIPGCVEKRESLVGECLYVDRFGNLITSIPSDKFEEWRGGGEKFRVNGMPARYALTFGYLETGETGLVPGSFGLVEVVVNRGNASERLRIDEGGTLVIGVEG